jgi:carbon-monoxide dehydrogenase catalytic subunit
MPVLGSMNVKRLLTEELFDIVGGGWAFEEDPIKASHIIVEHINRKREKLKLREMLYPPVTEHKEEVTV